MEDRWLRFSQELVASGRPLLPSRPSRPQQGIIPRNFGNWPLLKYLGRGGMAQVWLTRRLGAKPRERYRVAKVLDPTEDHIDLVARFEAEFRLLKQLRHRNVIECIEAGEYEGWHFMILELASGRDLAAHVLEHGWPSEERAAGLMIDAGKGLEHAHKRGVIHRDVKPSNLFLDDKMRLKVGDFGLAMAIESEDTGLTGANQVLGTPRYMAPERLFLRGTDHRADVFSLCIVFGEMLAQRHAVMDPERGPVVRGVTGKYAEVVKCGTAVDPAERFGGMGELVKAIKRARRGW